jgi:hypothetical protein
VSPCDTGDRIIHREVMELRASPERVRAFITTPERILDYYPQPVEGGVLEPGRALYCCGQMGVSLLEVLPDESTERCLVVRVTTAIGLEPPYDRDRIETHATFTMVEDWELEPIDGGTRLTKTWRDVAAVSPPPFPLEEAVREGAVHESPVLVRCWNAAAEADR